MRCTKRLTLTPQAPGRLACSILAATLSFLVNGAQTNAQSTTAFRWLSPQTDAATWAKIQDAFRGELRPDTSNPNEGVVFGFKFLERAGLIDHSALVIVGHKTAKNPKKEDLEERYSSAFSFDLDSGTITKVEHAEWMWHWKFKKTSAV